MFKKIFDNICIVFAIGVSILIFGGMLYGIYCSISDNFIDVLIVMGVMALFFMFLRGMDLLLWKWAKK